MFEVYHWQAEKPVTETRFLRCKRYNNRVKICQHIYFQSHGFNQGKHCSQDNLEHITPSKKACTLALITMITISIKKKSAQPVKYATIKWQGGKLWSMFWICNSDSNKLGDGFFPWTSWIHHSAYVLRYTNGLSIYSLLVLITIFWSKKKIMMFTFYSLNWSAQQTTDGQRGLWGGDERVWRRPERRLRGLVHTLTHSAAWGPPVPAEECEKHYMKR